MRKIIALLLTFVLLLSCLPAMAKSYDLPNSVRKDLHKRFSGYEIGDYDYGDSFLFVNVISGNTNTLVIYRDSSNQGNWKYWAQTRKAVPQCSGGTFKVSVKNGYYDHITSAKKYSYSTLQVYMQDRSGYIHASAWYSHVGGSVWKLMRYFNYDRNYGVTVGDNQLSYFSGSRMGNKIGTAYGNVQRDLRYVSLSSIPNSLTKAQQKLTNAPDLPDSTQLQVQEDVELKPGKKFPVYSAPWSTSVRGSNQKAAVSTNDWIQVFGVEDGYALIQYAVSTSRYRFGYISTSALKYPEEVYDLSFLDETVTITEDCEVTDDPIISGDILSLDPLTALSVGDTVTLLARMDEWVYIEAYNYRGFIPANAIGESAVGSSVESDDAGSVADDGSVG